MQERKRASLCFGVDNERISTPSVPCILAGDQIVWPISIGKRKKAFVTKKAPREKSREAKDLAIAWIS